jgi:predicted methyltransferase
LTEQRHISGDVAAAVGLAEGPLGVEAVLSALARLEPVSIRRLSRAVQLPVPIVASICGELRQREIVSARRPAQLTVLGRRLFAHGGLRLTAAASCPTCGGLGAMVPGELSGVAAELAKISRHAPPPNLELDQCHCTIGTKLRRVLAAHEADALVGRRVLLLGDDDLVSLAIALVVREFGAAETVTELAVVDVDDAVVDFLRAGLSGACFPVTCLRHDLRDPLPADLAYRFDTVLTDPPYTVEGARLFLTRAAEALRGTGSNVFFSFGSRRPGASFRVQREISELGFAIRRLQPDFNEYVGAGAIGGTSHLYHLVATPALRQSAATGFAEPVYSGHTRRRSRKIASRVSGNEMQKNVTSSAP